MPRRGDRGGATTRAHIAAVATDMFLARGFDKVTIAEVAAAAGVSKVTVFAHFEHKEDILLDRLPDAVEMVRAAVAGRDRDGSAVAALRDAAVAIADERHALSGLGPGTGTDRLMRTVLASPALIARLRAFEREIEAVVAGALTGDAGSVGDPDLAAALLVAAYRTVAVETIRRRLAGDAPDALAASHRARLAAAFDAVTKGLSAIAVS